MWVVTHSETKVKSKECDEMKVTNLGEILVSSWEFLVDYSYPYQSGITLIRTQTHTILYTTGM